MLGFAALVEVALVEIPEQAPIVPQITRPVPVTRGAEWQQLDRMTEPNRLKPRWQGP